MKIALVGSRVGYIDRGFESFTRNLFERLKDEIDITLFKGTGESSSKEIVVPAFRIEGGVLSKLGVSFRSREKIQERSFALGMLPWLLRNRYDAIHFSEVMLGRALLHLRRVFGFKYKLIFSNGAPAPPEFYDCFDLTQEVTGVRYDDALAYGIPKERLRLVPYSIDCDRFSAVTASKKNALRKKYDIPWDKQVVLCVAALKKHHKRIDVLIDEVGRLNRKEIFLVVAGHRTEVTPELEQHARSVLGYQFKFLTINHSQIHELYQCADLFALASLTEGLGIVILEAMSAGLPVVVHNDKSFRWVVGHEKLTKDLTKRGALGDAIDELLRDPECRESWGLRLAKETRIRFDWSNLKQSYLEMYLDASSNPRRGVN
ncbi:MAG: glycosyltransferase family 4 protein [Verrucomicrobiota bacterium]